MSDQQLTDDELAVLAALEGAYNLFVALPDSHPSDALEFAQVVHVLQRQVMCRPVRRAYPTLFGRPPESQEQGSEEDLLRQIDKSIRSLDSK